MGKEYMSEKKWLGLNVKHILFMVLASFLLARKRPFLRLLVMTYVKQMRLVKKVSFFHARVDLRCLAAD